MPLLARLGDPRLSSDLLTRLARQGVHTVEDLMTAPLADIAMRERLSVDVRTRRCIWVLTPQDLMALSTSILLAYTAPPITGEEILTQVQACTPLPSTCAALNRILSGGLHPSEWLELVGEPSSGKTQLCLYLACETARSGATVMYIDTGNSFSAERLLQMAWRPTNSATLEEHAAAAAILTRIRVQSAFDPDAFLTMLVLLRESLNAADPFSASCKFLIVDSLGALLSPLLATSLGRAMLMNIARQIKLLALQYRLAVVTTNYFVSGKKPALGESWTYVPHTQLQLEHIDQVSRQTRRLVLNRSPRSATRQTATVTLGDYPAFHDGVAPPPQRQHGSQ